MRKLKRLLAVCLAVSIISTCSYAYGFEQAESPVSDVFVLMMNKLFTNEQQYVVVGQNGEDITNAFLSQGSSYFEQEDYAGLKNLANTMDLTNIISHAIVTPIAKRRAIQQDVEYEYYVALRDQNGGGQEVAGWITSVVTLDVQGDIIHATKPEFEVVASSFDEWEPYTPEVGDIADGGFSVADWSFVSRSATISSSGSSVTFRASFSFTATVYFFYGAGVTEMTYSAAPNYSTSFHAVYTP